MGHGGWGIGHRAWGMGHGFANLKVGGLGMRRLGKRGNFWCVGR
ncbi:hypothetical protein [Microcoleus sp. FACHB-68]|nr:hypothetical protein [Microcoleus sp. FACHB-68]